MLCPGAMSHKTRCSSDAVAERKSAKLALFIQELFPGGLFGASCLFSWLWWTVSWTLRCTLPSAVKHNATRLHHSRVWGYRWPAVCLCSSPLGQLEPSISRPPPVYPRCVCLWGPDQQHSVTRVSHRVLRGDTFMRLFYYFKAFWDNPIWHFHAAKPFSIITPIYWQFWHFYLCSSPRGTFRASDDSILDYRSSSSSQHVQSQASLHLQMERIEAHYCVLGGASSSVNSLAHF